jgi:hypothetical protein
MLGWGVTGSLIAKVLPCSQIPSKYLYSKELYYCDRVEEGSDVSDMNEAYGVWKSLTSIFPPTSPCRENQTKLEEMVRYMAPSALPVRDCMDAKTKLEKIIPNYGCDTAVPLIAYTFKVICCSLCGGEPVPNMAALAELDAEFTSETLLIM